jgi:hypothetical protein
MTPIKPSPAKSSSKATTAAEKKGEQLDPLYVIFEQYLYNFQDSEVDRKTFVTKVVEEYLTWLRRRKIAVPKSLEPVIIDELCAQVRNMLVKKIYGFLSVEDYRQKNVGKNWKTVSRRAKTRYKKIQQTGLTRATSESRESRDTRDSQESKDSTTARPRTRSKSSA